MMPLRLSRRRLLLGSTVAVAAGYGLVRYAKTTKQQPITSIQAIIDTLVPRDEVGGALDLKLDRKFESLRQQQRTWQARSDRLIKFCDTLALKTHKKEFAELALSPREKLLTSAHNDQTQIQFRMDLSALKGLIFRWYYATDIGHNSLGYQLPSKYPAYSAAHNTAINR